MLSSLQLAENILQRIFVNIWLRDQLVGITCREQSGSVLLDIYILLYLKTILMPVSSCQ